MSLLKDELKEARIFERPLKGDFNGDGMCDVKSTCYQSNFKRLSPDYQAILVNSNSIVYLFEYDKKRRSFVKTNSRLIGP